MKDGFIKFMLVVVSLLLLLNLFHPRLASFLAPEAVAQPSQRISFRGNGVGIATSNNGKLVYAVSSNSILRSEDSGETWKVVVGN